MHLLLYVVMTSISTYFMYTDVGFTCIPLAIVRDHRRVVCIVDVEVTMHNNTIAVYVIIVLLFFQINPNPNT